MANVNSAQFPSCFLRGEWRPVSYQINFRVDIVGGRGGVPQCWTDPTILSFTSDKNKSVDEEGLEWKRSWQLWFSNFLCKQNKGGKESLFVVSHFKGGGEGAASRLASSFS